MALSCFIAPLDCTPIQTDRSSAGYDGGIVYYATSQHSMRGPIDHILICCGMSPRPNEQWEVDDMTPQKNTWHNNHKRTTPPPQKKKKKKKKKKPKQHLTVFLLLYAVLIAWTILNCLNWLITHIRHGAFAVNVVLYTISFCIRQRWFGRERHLFINNQKANL